MATTITKLLNITTEAYEEKTLDLWIRYTRCYAYDSESDWQKLLANSALNHWFLQELSKLESKFMQDFGFMQDFVSFTGHINPEDIMRAYNYEVGVKILTYRAPALLDAARKLNIITPIHN